SARLTPPGKKPPVDFELTGLRKQAPALAQQVATNILTWLKGQALSGDWNAQDEASRYFEEAKWAWKWKMLPEALAASDAAWALGKKEMDCATIRVNSAAYLATREQPLEPLDILYSQLPPRPWPPFSPERKDIELAIRALSAYDEISRMLPPDEPKLDSPLYDLGVETLTAASKLLQIYQFDPQLQPSVSEQLGELHALARAIASWMLRSPSVHD